MHNSVFFTVLYLSFNSDDCILKISSLSSSLKSEVVEHKPHTSPHQGLCPATHPMGETQSFPSEVPAVTGQPN